MTKTNTNQASHADTRGAMTHRLAQELCELAGLTEEAEYDEAWTVVEKLLTGKQCAQALADVVADQRATMSPEKRHALAMGDRGPRTMLDRPVSQAEAAAIHLFVESLTAEHLRQEMTNAPT